MNHCAYRGKHSTSIPQCRGELTHVIRDYWRAEARTKHGPDMALCEGHAEWLAQVNPLHKIEEVTA